MVKASPKRVAVRNKTVRPASKRICVMVLGMHRSGTSALTRVFNLLGCDLPQTLIGADRTNEPGHWEAAPVARLNDSLLESAGSRWDDWTEVNPDWFASPRAEEFREKALEVLEAEFGKSRIFVLKDPRICRLAPFWLDVLRDAGIQPIVVIPTRNPRDVASSLQARNDFEPGFSNLLWLRHVLEAERATRDVPRCFTGYDDLLANWALVVEQIRTRTGIAWPRYSAQSAAEIDSFLSERFRHHREGPESVVQNPSLSRWIRESYAILLDWIQSGERTEDYSRFDDIRDELNIASPAFGRLIASGHEGRKIIGRLRKEGAEQKVKLDAAVEAVARLEAREKELGAKLEALRAKLAEESAALERALAEARSDLTLRSDEVEDARREIKELAGRLSHTESALAQRSLEAEQTAAELAKVRGQLEQRTAELDGVFRAKAEVDQSLDAALSVANKASAEAAEVRDQLEKRSRDLDGALRAKSELEQSLSAIRRTAEQGIAEVAEVRGELERRARDLDGAMRAKSDIERSLSESRRAAEQAAAEIIAVRGRLEERERDLETAVQARSALEQSLAQIRREAEHAVAERIEVRGQLEQREHELDSALRARSELEQLLSRTRHEAELAAAELVDVRDRLDRQARDLADAQRERSELEESLSVARRQVEQIGAEVADALGRLEQREKELMESRRDAVASAEELEVARKDIEKLDRLVAEKERVAEGLREHIFMLKADFERQQATTVALEAEHSDALRAAARRDEEIRILKSESNRIKEELTSEINKVKAENDIIIADRTAELEKLRSDRDRAVADRVSAERKLWDRFDEIATLTRLLQEKEGRGGGGALHESDDSAKAIPGVADSRLMRLLPGRLRVRFQIQQLRKSGVFDPEWYVGYYEDIAKAGVDPYRHFIMHGAAEGRSPNAKWERGER